MSFFASFVTELSDVLGPLFGGSATAAAIVAFTLCVRLALHPLARAAVRGERVRARLAPRLAEARRRYGSDPQRLRRELEKVQAKEGASPAAGCLPMLLQLPVFFAMYHLFTTDESLLGHTLLGAPLGGRWRDALAAGGAFGGQGLVYVGLFVLVAAVATWTYVRTRRLMAASPASVPAGLSSSSGAPSPSVPGAAAMGRMLPLLPFGTLLTVGFVPLAAGLYVVTSTTWTAVERAALRAGRPAKREEQAGESAGGRRDGASGKPSRGRRSTT
ncbi:YidC/Oxa1 family membrane protein insertase [Streptomyces sp. Amel2xB2]|uniref:YidC/Oxa1 family membrane protein insertase n=1 Tax=Streptomyces sp. Amel2xB2 TaxID=1305829 RepID=UPI000DBA41E9|nr:membrane protein insertase YidC [Streptomyces sp. Amel2xB2]RAJ69741.1 YidC/Oxa1 family membrane protein insertase [Streptomyces sp. Amel2xB2]